LINKVGTSRIKQKYVISVIILVVLLVGKVGILLEDKTCGLRRIVRVSLDSPYDGAVVAFLSRTDFVKDVLRYYPLAKVELLEGEKELVVVARNRYYNFQLCSPPQHQHNN
jgi:hypothetical protein